MANLLFSCLTFSCPLDWMAETTIKARQIERVAQDEKVPPLRHPLA